MAINLSKIQADLGHGDPQIQTFALISVTRLAPTLVDDARQVRDLFSQLEVLIRSDNPDVVFLARKASNHLRAHFRGSLDDGPAAAPAPPRPAQDPATLDRQALLAEIEACQDPQLLSSLIIRMVEKGAAGDLPRLAPYLRHANDRVRSNALEVFARWGDISHLELVKPLTQDPSNRVRGTAVLALDRFGFAGVPESLGGMLQLPQISMRETAVWVLSQIDKSWVAPLLVQALDDPYDGIRLRAVRSLAKYPTKESVRALKNAMNDIDINICEAASESLRALKVLIQGAQEARRKVPDAAEVEAEPTPSAKAPAPAPTERPTARAESGEASSASAFRDLGTSIYQLCRLNAITHEGLDKTFYEILRYQDFLRGFLIQKQKVGQDADGSLDEKIRQLQGRIAKSFVELGRISQGLLSSQAIRIPGDHQAEVGGILARLRSAAARGEGDPAPGGGS